MMAAAVSAAARPARWAQPSATIMIGSGERMHSASASIDPDRIEAKRIAEAMPAAVPIRRMRAIVELSRLRG